MTVVVLYAFLCAAPGHCWIVRRPTTGWAECHTLRDQLRPVAIMIDCQPERRRG